MRGSPYGAVMEVGAAGAYLHHPTLDRSYDVGAGFTP